MGQLTGGRQPHEGWHQAGSEDDGGAMEELQKVRLELLPGSVILPILSHHGVRTAHGLGDYQRSRNVSMEQNGNFAVRSGGVNFI